MTISRPLLPPLSSPFVAAWCIMAGFQTLSPESAAAAPANADAAQRWLFVGPTSISTLRGRVSGRISSIAVDADGAVYVGAANGGVWRAPKPADPNWEPLTDREFNLAYGAVALAPGNNNAIYAGTGEARNCSDCASGSGAYKSVDRGRTWALLRGLPSEFTSAIVIDPANNSRVWIAGSGGVYRSTDAGASWKPVFMPQPSTSGRRQNIDLKLASTTPETLYVAYNEGAKESTDGGDTWVDIVKIGRGAFSELDPNSTYSISLAVSPANTSVVYASLAFTGNFRPGCSAGLFRSADSGATWTQLGNVPDYFDVNYAYGQGVGCFGWYSNEVAVDPRDANHVFAGGIALVESLPTAGGRLVWRNDSIRYGLHPDVHALSFGPDGALYVGNDGGLWRVTPAGVSQNLNSGLGITQFYGGVGRSADEEWIVAGTQDNGTNRSRGLRHAFEPPGFQGEWQGLYGGDGGFAAVDPTDPKIIYLETQRGDLRRSVDDGASWTNIAPQFESVNWVMPFVLDPGNSSVLYAGGDSLMKSTDKGTHWDIVAPAIANPNEDGNVSAITIGAEPGRIYFGRMNGTLMVSFDSGSTWAREPLPASASIASIAEDRSDSRQVYVALRSQTAYTVLKTTNITAATPQWTQMTTALPSAASVLLTVGRRLLAGTDTGVFRFDEPSQSWLRMGTGLPSVPVVELYAFKEGSVLALTHGRGAWLLSR